MNHESRPNQAAIADSRSEVESKSTAQERHGGRFSNVTVQGMRRLPAGSFRLFAFGSAGGRYYDDLGFKRVSGLPTGTVVDSSRLPDVLELAGVSEKTWENNVSSWVRLRMAHRCRPGSVALFAEPRDGAEALCSRCQRPLDRAVSLPAPGNVSPVSREESSRLPGESEHESLVASKAEKTVVGTAAVEAVESSKRLEDSSEEGSSEIAAFAALKRAGATIGEPLTDEQVRELGFEPTKHGWMPRKAASDAA